MSLANKLYNNQTLFRDTSEEPQLKNTIESTNQAVLPQQILKGDLRQAMKVKSGNFLSGPATQTLDNNIQHHVAKRYIKKTGKNFSRARNHSNGGGSSNNTTGNINGKSLNIKYANNSKIINNKDAFANKRGLAQYWSFAATKKGGNTEKTKKMSLTLVDELKMSLCNNNAGVCGVNKEKEIGEYHHQNPTREQVTKFMNYKKNFKKDIYEHKELENDENDTNIYAGNMNQNIQKRKKAVIKKNFSTTFLAPANNEETSVTSSRASKKKVREDHEIKNITDRLEKSTKGIPGEDLCEKKSQSKSSRNRGKSFHAFKNTEKSDQSQKLFQHRRQHLSQLILEGVERNNININNEKSEKTGFNQKWIRGDNDNGRIDFDDENERGNSLGGNIVVLDGDGSDRRNIHYWQSLQSKMINTNTGYYVQNKNKRNVLRKKAQNSITNSSLQQYTAKHKDSNKNLNLISSPIQETQKEKTLKELLWGFHNEKIEDSNNEFTDYRHGINKNIKISNHNKTASLAQKFIVNEQVEVPRNHLNPQKAFERIKKKNTRNFSLKNFVANEIFEETNNEEEEICLEEQRNIGKNQKPFNEYKGEKKEKEIDVEKAKKNSFFDGSLAPGEKLNQMILTQNIEKSKNIGVNGKKIQNTELNQLNHQAIVKKSEIGKASTGCDIEEIKLNAVKRKLALKSRNYHWRPKIVVPIEEKQKYTTKEIKEAIKPSQEPSLKNSKKHSMTIRNLLCMSENSSSAKIESWRSSGSQKKKSRKSTNDELRKNFNFITDRYMRNDHTKNELKGKKSKKNSSVKQSSNNKAKVKPDNSNKNRHHHDIHPIERIIEEIDNFEDLHVEKQGFAAEGGDRGVGMFGSGPQGKGCDWKNNGYNFDVEAGDQGSSAGRLLKLKKPVWKRHSLNNEYTRGCISSLNGLASYNQNINWISLTNRFDIEKGSNPQHHQQTLSTLITSLVSSTGNPSHPQSEGLKEKASRFLRVQPKAFEITNSSPKQFSTPDSYAKWLLTDSITKNFFGKIHSGEFSVVKKLKTKNKN